MVKPWFGHDADANLLAYLHDLAVLRREVDDPAIPFDHHEWDGRSRQEAAEELQRDILAAVDEAKRRGLDFHEAYWDEPRPEPSP